MFQNKGQFSDIKWMLTTRAKQSNRHSFGLSSDYRKCMVTENKKFRKLPHLFCPYSH